MEFVFTFETSQSLSQDLLGGGLVIGAVALVVVLCKIWRNKKAVSSGVRN